MPNDGNETFDMEHLLELAEEKKYRLLKEELVELNEVDIASFIEELDSERTVIVFRMLPKALATEVFAELPVDKQSHIINSITDKELSEIVDELYVDDAVDLVEELPATVVRRVLQNTKPETRKLINQFLNYPENSAGSIMTTEYVDLKPHLTVGQALAHIKETGIHKETIYTCYVIQQRKLLGIVSAKDLMTTDDNVLIEDIMETEIISVSTLTDKEDVAHQLRKYDLLALPVLDTDGLLVGIVTFDDAMDVMVEEATEDITKMAAVSPSEKTYFEVSAWEHAKRRIPWLLVLMFSSIITGTIITRYENAFAAIPLLVSFIPMLMDTGGNCGSQSSTLIIRGIALNQVTFHDFFRVIWKEFRVSLIVGVVLAVANGLRIYLTYQQAGMAVVIALSLVATVISAKLLGCILPMCAKKIGLDPALMASPLITTIVDASSIMIYFFIATKVFHL